MVDFTDMTERAGQVIGADKNNVDAGYVQNFIEIVDRLLTLGLKDDHGVLCTREILAAGNRAEACRTDKTAGASRSDGRKLRGGNSGTRLLCGVDLRDHDRACADIQSLIDPDIAAAGYADDRAYAGDVCCTDQIGEFLEGGGAVLHIEQHEIISGMTCGFHHRRVRTDHERAKRAPVRIHCRLETIHAFHRRHNGLFVHMTIPFHYAETHSE